MWFGALLALTWLILLLRYPAKALPVSLVALTGLLLVGALVLWQDHRDQQRVAQLALTLQWDASCPHETPLRANLHQVGSYPEEVDRPQTVAAVRRPAPRPRPRCEWR